MISTWAWVLTERRSNERHGLGCAAGGSSVTSRPAIRAKTRISRRRGASGGSERVSPSVDRAWMDIAEALILLRGPDVTLLPRANAVFLQQPGSPATDRRFAWSADPCLAIRVPPVQRPGGLVGEAVGGVNDRCSGLLDAWESATGTIPARLHPSDRLGRPWRCRTCDSEPAGTHRAGSGGPGHESL